MKHDANIITSRHIIMYLKQMSFLDEMLSITEQLGKPVVIRHLEMITVSHLIAVQTIGHM